MSLAGQWTEIESALPDGWDDARLRLDVLDPTQANHAAALLGPAQPYRSDRSTLHFSTSRHGGAPGPDGIRRLLSRLDRERIRGTLALLSSQAAPARREPARTTIAASWAEALAQLPADWSDLHAEVELRSTDYIERAALLMSPLNPRRDGRRAALRFRCAKTFGYGASPEMVRRCFERCDTDGIGGAARVLRVLSDTDPVQTQGPVWHVGGRTV